MAIEIETDRPENRSIRRAKLLRPRALASGIYRPRLIDLLASSLDVPLTIVSAPGGFGKTTFMVAWAAELDLPSAWLSLDEGDNALGVWAPHLLTAIEQATGQPCTAAWAHLEDSNTPDIDPTALAIALSGDLLDMDSGLVLILDDFHCITDQSVQRNLEELLRYPLPGVHVVIATREEPRFLPLPLFRARGQLVEIRGADLRFTDEEVAEYLEQVIERQVDPSMASRVSLQTGGWPAAVGLAAMAIKRGGEKEASSLAVRGSAIDFLFDEILLSQSPELQHFLLVTSIVEHFSVPLAEALFDAPRVGQTTVADVLDQLVSTNQFVIRLGQDGNWYNYHDLFQDMLQRQLTRSLSPEAVRDLHRRAAAWFDAAGDIDAALAHALAAGEAERAAGIIESHALRTPDLEGFHGIPRWLSALPASMIEQRPGLKVVEAWHLFGQGRQAAMQPLIAAAADLRAADGQDDPLMTRAIDGHLALLSVFADVPPRTIPEMDATLDQALDLLPPDHYVARGVALYFKAIALQSLGKSREAIAMLDRTFATAPHEADALRWRCLASIGEVRTANGELHAVLRDSYRQQTLMQARGDPMGESWATGRIGMVKLLMGRLDEAASALEVARREQRHRHNRTTWRGTMIALSLTHMLSGRHAQAQEVESELIDLLYRGGDGENLVLARSAQARLALLAGRVDDAVRWLDSEPAMVERLIPFRTETDSMTRLKVWLAMGTPEHLQQVISEGTALLERIQRLHASLHEVEARLILALACQRLGQIDRMTEESEIAGSLAAGCGLVLPFIELRWAGVETLFPGQPLREPALPMELPSLQGPVRTSATRTLFPFEPRTWQIDDVANSQLIEPLTERELQILLFMIGRLSNKEIAEALSISPLTVKRHASNLFEKLGVGHRRRAVDRAIELGIAVRPYD